MKATLPVLLAALLIPAPVWAETVEVLGYLRKEVQVFDAAGVPDPKPVAVSRLPATPYVSKETGPAKSVGFPLDGKIVFVRRLDLKLGAAPCIKVASGGPARPGGTVQAGQRMGAGDSAECLVQ